MSGIKAVLILKNIKKWGVQRKLFQTIWKLHN